MKKDCQKEEIKDGKTRWEKSTLRKISYVKARYAKNIVRKKDGGRNSSFGEKHCQKKITLWIKRLFVGKILITL